VTFHVLNQRNPGRTETTPKVRIISADSPNAMMGPEGPHVLVKFGALSKQGMNLLWGLAF